MVYCNIVIKGINHLDSHLCNFNCSISRNLPDAHFGTIKNHVGQNCTIGRQIQKLGILVFVFVGIAAKCPFLLTSVPHTWFYISKFHFHRKNWNFIIVRTCLSLFIYDQGWGVFIWEKKISRAWYGKKQLWFYLMYKIWQTLKHFSRQLILPHSINFWRVVESTCRFAGE